MKYPIAVPVFASIFFAGFLSEASANTDCGKVVISDMNWNSATLAAHVDKFILKNGMGCKAELVPGDTIPSAISMIEKGQPDLTPELWTNTLMVAPYVKEGRLKLAGNLFEDGAQEAFWVPQYMVDEYPELATIDGIRKHAELFKHPEIPGKSAVYNCPAGWACQISTANLFKALELGKEGFELVDPGSGGALASIISRAYERKEPWLGYYWSPTPIMGKYPMVMVDFKEPVDVDEFLNCTTQPDCLDPKVTMFPPATVTSLVTSSFAEKSPVVMEYLDKRSYSTRQMNEMLSWMDDYQADGDMAMEHFLRKYPSVWESWLTESQTKNVQRALRRL